MVAGATILPDFEPLIMYSFLRSAESVSRRHLRVSALCCGSVSTMLLEDDMYARRRVSLDLLSVSVLTGLLVSSGEMVAKAG